MNRKLAILLCAAALFDSTLLGQEANPVQSELGLEDAWIGQAVPLVITLVSPGPFSGTAVFQLPEIPNTLIVKQGSPLVGSETVGGESMITQRHEFSIYTQQVGTVEIPAFPIDFESKETFTGDPVPRTGKTTALTFNSKRAPGTEGLPFVVSSATLTVKESWSPADQTEFDAGDILSRTITREASDVNAMFLQPFQPEPIDGVRIYPTEPEVIDKRERGVATAKRGETIKYQFERGGTFTIPEIAASWWNPKTEKIEQVKLEGLTVSATAPPVPPKPVDKKKIVLTILLILAALPSLKRFLLPLLKKRYRAWHAQRHSPEAEASRALIQACRENEPGKAFAELMNWQRAIGADSELSVSLRKPSEELSRYMFSKGDPDHRWDGNPLLIAFQEAVHRRKRRRSCQGEKEKLPPLNPRLASES